MVSTPYGARLYIVKLIYKGQGLLQNKIPAFSRDHAAQIVWDKGPIELTSDAWEEIKFKIATEQAGFLRVYED